MLKVILLLAGSTISCFASSNSCGFESLYGQLPPTYPQSMYVDIRVKETPHVQQARDFSRDHNVLEDALPDVGAHRYGAKYKTMEISGRPHIEFFVLKCGAYAKSDAAIVIDSLFIPIRYPLDMNEIVQRNFSKLSEHPNLLEYMPYLNIMMDGIARKYAFETGMDIHQERLLSYEEADLRHLSSPFEEMTFETTEGPITFMPMVEVQNFEQVVFQADDIPHHFHEKTTSIDLSGKKITQIPFNLADLTQLKYLSLSFGSLEGSVSLPPLPPSLDSLILTKNAITSFTMKSGPECFVTLQDNALTEVSIEGRVSDIILTLDGAAFQCEEDFNRIASVLVQPNWSIFFKKTYPYLYTNFNVTEGSYIKLDSRRNPKPLIWNLVGDYSGKPGRQEHPLLEILAKVKVNYISQHENNLL